MKFKDTGCEGAYVILLAQDGDKCPAVVNTGFTQCEGFLY